MEEKVEIKIDPRNYRIHGDENKRLIHKSLVECGAGRSVLADRDNVLIAGNGVYDLMGDIARLQTAVTS